jgi:transcription initiation factor TFIIE subunit alpha
MEVDRVMDFTRGIFICEDCGAELVDNEDAESVKGNQDRMQRFNRQMSFIREGLRKSEAMVLPAYVTHVRHFLSVTDLVRKALMLHCG